MDDIINRTVTVTAKFVNKNTGLPLNDSKYEFQLFDEDLIKDDVLGFCTLNSNGEVKLSFDIKKIRSFDSPMETRPDLWFSLSDGTKEIYKSDVLKNLDFEKHGRLSVDQGYIYNLGTYVV
jgi:hypothetical protein